MDWLTALVIVVSVAIASAAYLAPKLMFLSLQAAVLTEQKNGVADLDRFTAGEAATGVADSGSYI